MNIIQDLEQQEGPTERVIGMGMGEDYDINICWGASRSPST